MQAHRISWIAFWFATLAMLPAGNEARCQIPVGHFTDVRLVPNVNSGQGEGTPHISANGLTLYFASNRGGGLDIFQATRSTVNDEFGGVMRFGNGVNSSAADFLPTTSFDDLTLYFTSNRSEGAGDQDIYQATRTTIHDAFGDVMPLMGAGINTEYDDRAGHISDNGLTLYMTSDRPDGEGGFDAYMATRENVNDEFAGVTTLGSELNSPFGEQHPSVSSNGLIFFFADEALGDTVRPDGQGGPDMWIAVRTSTGEPFGNVVNLNDFSLGSNVNGPLIEAGPSISHDWPAPGSQLFFTSGPDFDGLDIYQATWVLTADFDQNGVLDCLDIDALVAEIAAGTHNPDFDLTGDTFVDLDDRDVWLADAGTVNLPSGNAYLLGDATLDGVVDVSDFNTWNANKFTAVAAWCSGNFNADSAIDVSDFNLWNENKFLAADGVSAVPEPGTYISLLAALFLASVSRTRRECPPNAPTREERSCL